MFAPWGPSLAWSSIHTIVAAQQVSHTTCLFIHADRVIHSGHLVSVLLVISEPVTLEIALAGLHSTVLFAVSGNHVQLLGSSNQAWESLPLTDDAFTNSCDPAVSWLQGVYTTICFNCLVLCVTDVEMCTGTMSWTLKSQRL